MTNSPLPNNDPRRRVPTIVVASAVLLVVGGALYPDQTPFMLNDLFAHGIVYFVLAMLFIIVRPISISLSICLLLTLSVATEAAQLFVPMRQADPMDVIANLVGVGVAHVSWLLGRFIARRIRPKTGFARS